MTEEVKTITNLKIQRKIPEWVILLVINVVFAAGTIILTAAQNGQIHLEQWALSLITLILSIVRMFNKTHQDVTIINQQSNDLKK